jgi:RNA polymerase sigma factor (sigma-70 family)
VDLVRRARQGDHDAFAVLARDASIRLDAAARLILRDPELARDMLRDPERFDAWLHRLTVHACLDQARRRRSRPIEVELTPIFEAIGPDHSRDVVERDALDRALANLETEQRAVVVLHYYLDLPLPEAAATLGIPLGTAKSSLHRALAALRRVLDVEAAEPAYEGGPAR